MSPRICVDSVETLRTGGRSFEPSAGIIIPRIDDNNCDRIHSSLTAVRCFDNGYVGKQPVAWKEYCAEYWLKELQESMDSCNSLYDVTEITLKTVLNIIESINPLNPNFAERIKHG